MSDKTEQNEPDLPGPDQLTARVPLIPTETGVDGKTETVFPLPGMVAIGLYMLVLAAVIAFGVVSRHISPLMLIVVPFFAAASFGLLRMFRWAWALTLSAVFLLMSYNLWLFATEKQAPGAVQGLLNLVFFFYLVRPDVRSRLR
jgi:hypothetical protein